MRLHRLFFASFVVLLFVSVSLFGQERSEKLPSKEFWNQVTFNALIEDIDYDSREVTLRGPGGKVVTVEVDARVERFHEFKVGDRVSAEYWTYLKAEFREPTAEERSNPLVVVAEGGRAPEGMDPSGVVGAVVRALVTVDLVNRTEGYATLKGPRGKYMTVQVADQNLLDQIKVRDEIIMTYAEALALSLEKLQ
jgi:hypothetical protein